MKNTISYEGRKIEVSAEVAEFLESDRKRKSAEGRSDRRHLIYNDINSLAVNGHLIEFSNPTLNTVLRKLRNKKLYQVLSLLDKEDLTIILLYYFCDCTQEEIADRFSCSKMAISKRIRKLLKVMRELMET